MKEIYISNDVESDGPIPGPNSMISFSAVAFDEDGTPLSYFIANLRELPDATADEKTMKWWKKHPKAWKRARKGATDPGQVMQFYVEWIKNLGGKPVFVAYPAGYDFLFIYWYLMYFQGESPYSHSALDIKTYACAIMKSPYRKSTKRHMPTRWFEGTPKHTHGPEDAMEQGILFMNMRCENLAESP